MQLSSVKKDSAGIAAGRRITDIPNMGDLVLQVRGLTSPIVTTLRDRKERAVEKKGRLRDGTLKPDVRIAIFREVLAEAVLINWEGMTDVDPNDADKLITVVYDPELAKELCTNPDYADFSDAVAWAASVVDRGVKEEDDEILGKSSTTSPGTSSSENTQPA